MSARLLRRSAGRALTRARGWKARHLPRGMNIAGPVIQLYIHDALRTTTFSFVNFPSLYAPRGAQSYRYTVECRGSDGAKFGRQTLTVPAFGAVEAEITQLFGTELPPWGTVHVSLRPTSFFTRHDQHLGRLTPHFYALYHEPEMGFLALVHPQTEAWAGGGPLEEWRSTLLIDTELAEFVEAFQINPTARSVTSELRVYDEDGVVLTSASTVLPAFGVRRERWVVKDLGAGRWVSLGADRLAAPNAKPLVFATNRAGLISGSHS